MFLPKATPIRCPKKKQATPLKNTPPSRWSKITENLMEIPTQMPLQHAGLLPHFDHQRLLTSINSYKPLMETHIFHYFPVFFAGLKNHRDQIHPFFQGTPWPRAEGRWQRMPRPFLSASGWDHRSLPASGLWHSQLEKNIPWFQSTNQEKCVYVQYIMSSISEYIRVYFCIYQVYIYIQYIYLSSANYHQIRSRSDEISPTWRKNAKYHW